MNSTDQFSSTTSPTTGPSEESATDVAASALQGAGHEASNIAASAQDQAMQRLESGKEAATKTLQEFAGVIRKAGDELAQHDQSMAGQMVRQAADGLEHFARAVSDRPPSEMLSAVRDFGRDNPVVFAAGSVLLGLAIGRFARSSERHGLAGAGASGRTSGPSSQDYAPDLSPTAEPPRSYGEFTYEESETANGAFSGEGLGRSPSPLGVEI